MNEDKVVVELKELEALYIWDNLSIQEEPPAIPFQEPSFPGLFLQINECIAATKGDTTKTYPCEFTLADLWLIKEVTKSSAMVGQVRVGMAIIHLIIPAIKALSQTEEINELESLYSADREEVNYEIVNGRARSSDESQADDAPPDGTGAQVPTGS